MKKLRKLYLKKSNTPPQVRSVFHVEQGRMAPLTPRLYEQVIRGAARIMERSPIEKRHSAMQFHVEILSDEN